MKSMFYEKIDGIIEYLKESGVSADKIFFTKKEIDNSCSGSNLNGKERIVMNLVSKSKGIDFMESSLKGIFGDRNSIMMDKVAPTDMKFVTLKKDLFNNDNAITHSDFGKTLDSIARVLKDDPDSSLSIKEYVKTTYKVPNVDIPKVVNKKWYEHNLVMGLTSFLFPLLGSIMIFLNRYLPKGKKLLLGLLALGWGAISYFGLAKLSSLGALNLPKGLIGLLTGIIPLIGAGMIFFNEHLSGLKKGVFGLATLGLGFFSFNGLMKLANLGNLISPKNIVSGQLPKLSDLEIGKLSLKGPETKTLGIFNMLDAKLKDIIARKDLTLTKISDKEIKLIAQNNITFDTNKSTLGPEFLKVLEPLASVLNENKGYKVTIDGFTDNVGPDSLNDKLSLDRAQSVAKYLKERGVSEDRITYRGYGSKSPVASNDTADGRKANRRIEMRVATE